MPPLTPRGPLWAPAQILYYKITQNDLAFPAHVSAKAQELIRSLMRVDPVERLTSSGALRHAWLAGDVARMGLVQTLSHRQQRT